MFARACSGVGPTAEADLPAVHVARRRGVAGHRPGLLGAVSLVNAVRVARSPGAVVVLDQDAATIGEQLQDVEHDQSSSDGRMGVLRSCHFVVVRPG